MRDRGRPALDQGGSGATGGESFGDGEDAGTAYDSAEAHQTRPAPEVEEDGASPGKGGRD